MKAPAIVSLEVSAVASTLHVRLDGIFPAIVRGGRTLFPAQQSLTIIDPASPAHGATFSVAVDALTCDTLRARYAETVARFAAAL